MRIELPSGTPAELARPPEGTVSPERGVVVACDIGGLRPLFDQLCARLAADQGWPVIAVEPFPGREDLDLQGRFAVMPELQDERQLGDLAAAAAALEVEPVALIGFCMGGMYALKGAATGRFDRVVSFYGMIRVPEDWKGGGHREPLDALAEPGAADVLAIIGEEDPWTPAADVAALEASGATVVRYPGAEHGFVHDPDRPAHRPEAAADAWDRALAFLRAGLGEGAPA